jgi:hypothetical protein
MGFFVSNKVSIDQNLYKKLVAIASLEKRSVDSIVASALREWADGEWERLMQDKNCMEVYNGYRNPYK